MRLSQLRETQEMGAKPTKRRKAPASKSLLKGLAAHKAFVPILTIWGAALLGLIILVLPQSTIGKFGAVSGGLIAGDIARILLAVIAAMLGGALGFVGAMALRKAASPAADARDLYTAYSAARPRPIDPASDLGSESLDAPLDHDGDEELAEFEEASAAQNNETHDAAEKKPEPTLGELSKRGYEMEAPEEDTRAGEWAFTHGQYKQALIECCEGESCEAAPSDDARAEPTPPSPLVAKPRRSADTKPRALDLGEFAELPGRNAVWVEGDAGRAPEATPSEPAVAPVKAKAPVAANALEKLRQKPTDELSLVEMVERFAGALHEHQQTERARSGAGAMGRDAALAEALKALTLFTENGFNSAGAPSDEGQLGQAERDLREALSKLQTLRGAA